MATWFKIEFTGEPTEEDFIQAGELVSEGYTEGQLQRPLTTPHAEHTLNGPADCSRCNLIRENQDWLALPETSFFYTCACGDEFDTQGELKAHQDTMIRQHITGHGSLPTEA